MVCRSVVRCIEAHLIERSPESHLHSNTSARMGASFLCVYTIECYLQTLSGNKKNNERHSVLLQPVSCWHRFFTRSSSRLCSNQMLHISCIQFHRLCLGILCTTSKKQFSICIRPYSTRGIKCGLWKVLRCSSVGSNQIMVLRLRGLCNQNPHPITDLLCTTNLLSRICVKK